MPLPNTDQEKGEDFIDVERLLGWCIAFAGMIALELASQGNGARPATAALLGLAAQAPAD